MTTAAAVPESSLPFKILKLPFKTLWFIIRHPFLCLFVALFIAVGTVSTLAHFHPQIAQHFNNTVAYFGAATIASELGDTFRTTQSDLKFISQRLQSKEAELVVLRKKSTTHPELLEELEKSKARNAELTRENSKVRSDVQRADKRIVSLSSEKQKMSLRLGSTERQLAETHGRLQRFGKAGKHIEAQIPRRFTKVALYDGAGELLGIIPILGDAASIGMTVGGLYEMCQMFKEIELATTELHVPYNIYTGTFCQDPAGKSKEAMVEVTVTARESFKQKYEQFKESVKTTFRDWFPGHSKQHS